MRVSDPRLTARLHEGPGGSYLWIATPKRQAAPAWVEVPAGKYEKGLAALGPEADWQGGGLSLTVPPRQVIIYELA